MFARTLLPVLAVLGFAAAQSSNDACSTDITINAQGDVDTISDCTTFTGDITVGSSASGVISIDGPEQIVGNLIAHNAGNLVSLGSTSLTSVSKAIDLFNLTTLSTFSFNELTSVYNISWQSLPALSSLTLPAVISEATYVLITNTFLSSLDGININTASVLDVNNNNRLDDFSTQVANVTSMINIDSNGKLLTVSFPNLLWAANMTLRTVASVSFPSLATVNGSLGLYENYFTSVAAPNLTTVGNFGGRTGGLAFVSNDNLANISIPGLTSVGGAFQIANNTMLDGTLSFPKLSTIGGAIDFTGNFSGISLPDLTIVSGGSNIYSTASLGNDCSSITSDSAIAGTNHCNGNTADPSAAASSGASKTTSGSSSTSKSAAVTFGVSEAVIGLGLLGALVQLLL